MPLAYAKLFRLLTPRWWLWSVGVLIVILVAAGETHRWYGNFAFVRIWQGKAVFLSVALPLIYAYGLRFAVQPTMRGWITARCSPGRGHRLHVIRAVGRPGQRALGAGRYPSPVAPEPDDRGHRSARLGLRAGRRPGSSAPA